MSCDFKTEVKHLLSTIVDHVLSYYYYLYVFSIHDRTEFKSMGVPLTKLMPGLVNLRNLQHNTG